MGKGGKEKDRGRGRDGHLPRNVQISKKLSWLLRHGAEGEGLTVGTGGYVNVADVLNNRKLHPLKVSMNELREIVENNEKQRFSLIPDPAKTELTSRPIQPLDPMNSDDTSEALSRKLNLEGDADIDEPSNFLIRANQGHSMKIDSAELLVPINEQNMPRIVVHGTKRAVWPRILSSGGLRKMARTHIHFAPGLPRGWVTSEGHGAGSQDIVDEQGKTGMGSSNNPEVVSGMRNTSEILIYVDLPKALADGYKFWLSENGVILTEGDQNGVLPTAYFKHVEEANKGDTSRKAKVLFHDGAEMKG